MADVGKAAESASMIVCGYALTPAEGEDFVLVGFKEAEWTDLLLG